MARSTVRKEIRRQMEKGKEVGALRQGREEFGQGKARGLLRGVGETLERH